MTQNAVLSLGDMVQKLAELVWQFDCEVREGELKILTSQNVPSPGAKRRQHGWEPVGQVWIDKSREGEAKIWEVYDSAPDYLKPLKGRPFPSKPVLLNAIRRASFQHNAKELLKGYLSAEIKQLEDDG